MQRSRGVALALFVALVAGASPASADVLGRALRVLDDGETGGPAPPPADDLLSWAGPTRATSLPALLSNAVERVPSLASAKLDIEVAEARIQQTMSRDDWRIRGQAYAQSSSGFISGFRIDRSTTIGGFAELSRVLPTGGTIAFRASTDYSRVTSPIDGSIQTNWTEEVNVSFIQPLLEGRGRWLYEANERRAALSRDAAVLAKRLAAINTVQVIVSAYWDLVLAERQVAITRASLALAQERLRITQIGADGGKVPRSELPAVQQIIATRQEEILSAELAVLDRSIALRRAAGMPIGAGELGLRVETDLATREVTWDLGALTQRAFDASPELAQLAKQDASTKILIDVTENGLMPRLDAAITLGPRSQADTPTQALRDLARVDSFAITGSLTVEHSLGQEQVRGQAREARANLRQLEVNAFDIRAQIAQTMARAVAQLELARRRIELSQRAIDLANENIKIESDRFNLGRSTNFDVLNRQEELRQAELRKSQAMIDWHKAESVVQALTADILPAYGITTE